MEMEQTRQEKDALLKSVNDTRSRIEETTAKRAEMERSLETVQHDLAEKKEFYEQYRSDLTNIKLEMTSYREKIDALSKEIMALKEAIDESNRVRETVAEEIAQNNALIQQKTDAIGGLDEKLKQHIIQIDGLRSEIASKKEEIESRALSLSEMEKQIRGLRNEIEEVSQRVSSLEVARTESRLKMENIFNNIIQMYGINIELHETSYPTEEEIEKLPSLRTTIQSIGPVNLATIEEYEELKERYEFLTTQGDDLTKSIEELEEAIKKINYTTRKRLRDAYTQLNDKFSEVFMHLFGGGKANLVLTDEQNILESGIDIIAQPPGKKLQNITLLSGGEKALTAISLTFAGFLIKPAPICLLDEADAPLDESNSGKYAAIVRELSKDTQFIVITHNRTTMEAADYIYGITMEEPGASKVISMQLTEA